MCDGNIEGAVSVCIICSVINFCLIRKYYLTVLLSTYKPK